LFCEYFCALANVANPMTRRGKTRSRRRLLRTDGCIRILLGI
jgi:hypothetical protein